MSQRVQASLAPLYNKRVAELSGGRYQRGMPLRAANRSRYNPLRSSEPTSLAMGIVQAVLAVLTLHVETSWWDERGLTGYVKLLSTTRSRDAPPYLLSWDVRDRANPAYGGFAYGLTYQFAVVELIRIHVRPHLDEPLSEVSARWEDLIRFCHGVFPLPREEGWTRDQIATLCENEQMHVVLECLADALWFEIRYLLPNVQAERTIWLSQEQVIAQETRWPNWARGVDLLICPSIRSHPQRVMIPRLHRRKPHLSDLPDLWLG